MSTSELAQLELLSQVDDLVTRLSGWANEPTVWTPLERVRHLLGRILERVDPLRLRMDAPLVVSTFGGTGVGKSSLVNALIGEDVAMVGRQRPTTTQPTLICHRDTNLQPYHFPLEEMRVVQRDARLLRDWMIIDCPDPDTSETAETGTNLDRLHRILPFCDVLLYVSTQQKYRSAKVSGELAQAAAGCKLIFIQTHADRDADVRDDWRRQLEPGYRVADMFFVDSRHAWQEQQSGLRPTGDFGRLLDVLQQELTAQQRVRIRQGNLFGLLDAALTQCQQQLALPAQQVQGLQAALQDQRQQLSRRLSERLATELFSSRGLWERRLLGEVAQRWGLSPFSLVLRAWHGQASLLASWTLLRARNSAQVALWGAVHGARWLTSRQREADDLQHAEDSISLESTDAEWQEARLIVEGHARTAGLMPAEMTTAAQRLPVAAANAEQGFWNSARDQIGSEIAGASYLHVRWPVRIIYEAGFAILPLWILYRIGKNFFYDSWIFGKPLLESTFYIPALLFLALWTGLTLMLFTARLRRGMTRRVKKLAEELATVRLPSGLFPHLDLRCRQFHQQVDQLNDLATMVRVIREQIAEAPGLSHAIVDGK